MKNKRIYYLLFILFCSTIVKSQQLSIKTNLIYWGTASPNLGTEFSLGRKSTMEIGGSINPFTFSDNKKLKHWLIQPEWRWWLCEKFNGHFFGIHAHAAEFNIGGWDIPIGRFSKFKDHRYEGYLYGAGISYGYQWVLSRRWNLEFSIGGGYARVNYKKYPCVTCGKEESDGTYNYWGVTKAALSLIYFIK